MKVCLVRSEFEEKINTVYPPFGLVTIASYFDAKHVLGWADLQAGHSCGYLCSYWDVVAYSAFTSQLATIQKTIQCAKNMGVKSKFVVGGPAVTSNPEYAQRLVPDADLFVAGDGECFAENVEALLDDGQKLTDFRQTPCQLEHKKLPRWDLIDYKRYVNTTGLAVETSRGCPMRCRMCTAHTIHGRQFRSRKPADVVEELKILQSKFGCSKYYFADDNATANPDRWHQLMREIADEKLNLCLTVPEGIQAHHLTRETLLAMKEAGLKEFTIGAESGCQRVLDEVVCKGGLTVDKIEEVVRTSKELGMKANCFFIIGFPGESLAEAKQTVVFADRLRHVGAYRCMVRNLIPMPGTEVFEEAKREGLFVVPVERLFDFEFVHKGNHLLKTASWKPDQIETLVAESKLKDDFHFLCSHPELFVQHPRASLRLLSKNFSAS
jgi:radical SAM superfamily enzyme YgiQ (UPF0313 family)